MIVRDVEEDESLPGAHVAILGSFANHVREGLGGDSSGECSGLKDEGLTILTDHIILRLCS